jgi:hypothetical protein
MHLNRAQLKTLQAKSSIGIVPALFFAAALLVLLIILSYFTVIPDKVHGLGMLLFKGELDHIVCPRTGTLLQWDKEEGDVIHRGEKLATILDHKTDEMVDVISRVDGVIAEVIVFGNSFVERGQSLAVISHEGDPRHDLELTGFVSSLDGKKIEPGMMAMINPTITKQYEHGYLLARVKRVGKLPLTKAAVLSIIKIPEVADFIREQIRAEPFMVVLEPIKNEKNITGYRWTGPGPRMALDSGVFADFVITVDEERLLTKLIPHQAWQRMDRAW